MARMKLRRVGRHILQVRAWSHKKKRGAEESRDVWSAIGEVEIEERSFVARNAPLDDGQGRVGVDERSAAEPEALKSPATLEI
jgi:hypothetical protein